MAILERNNLYADSILASISLAEPKHTENNSAKFLPLLLLLGPLLKNIFPVVIIEEFYYSLNLSDIIFLMSQMLFQDSESTI